MGTLTLELLSYPSLVALKQFHERVYPSVYPSIPPSIRLSIQISFHPSASPSVRQGNLSAVSKALHPSRSSQSPLQGILLAHR